MSTVGQTESATGSNSINDPSVQYEKPKRVLKQELDKDAFLQLLVAQMKYQDPSSPMDMNGLMQQTSMMTTVEKLTELASTSRSQFMMQQQIAAASMVGQTVTWLDEKGDSQTGAVSAVDFSKGQAMLQVSDKAVPWDRVTRLTATAEPATSS